MAAFAMSRALSLVGTWEDFIPFVGAPLGGVNDAAIRRRFGIAVDAARTVARKRLLDEFHLSECVVPRHALEEIRDAIAGIGAGSQEVEERIIPEAHAAMTATEISRASLGGRNCVIDMGAGTTDLSWFTPRGWSSLGFYATRSIQVGGENFDDELRAWMLRHRGMRLDRGQLWLAKSMSDQSGSLIGEDWQMPASAVHEICEFHAMRVASHVARSAGPASDWARARFIFVGGATKFPPLRHAIVDRLRQEFGHVEEIEVPEPRLFPLGASDGQQTLDAAMWVAMGLARWLALPEAEQRTSGGDEAEDEIGDPGGSGDPIRCTCLGSNDDCFRCGGIGVIVGYEARTGPTDSFEDRSGWIPCNYCNHRIDPAVLDDHIRSVHLRDEDIVVSSVPVTDPVHDAEIAIRHIEYPGTYGSVAPTVERLVRALGNAELTIDDLEQLLRKSRPSPSADQDGELNNQTIRAVRSLLWLRIGRPDHAADEARAIRLEPLRRYLSERGVSLDQS